MKRALLLAATMVAALMVFGGTASAACVPPYCPAPSVATRPATNVTDTTATLTGAVNVNGSGPTSYYFQTGPGFGTVLGQGVLPDSTALFPVTTNLTGLTPSTTYSYRLAANNFGGYLWGSVVTFTTLATTPSGGGGGGGGGVPSTSPKVDPNAVSISARPRRDRHAPFRYRVTGGVEVDDGALCASGGEVTITLSRGAVLTSRTVNLEADCGYQATMRVRRSDLPRHSSGRINVRSSFSGNDQLNGASSETVKVRLR